MLQRKHEHVRNTIKLNSNNITTTNVCNKYTMLIIGWFSSSNGVLPTQINDKLLLSKHWHAHCKIFVIRDWLEFNSTLNTIRLYHGLNNRVQLKGWYQRKKYCWDFAKKTSNNVRWCLKLFYFHCKRDRADKLENKSEYLLMHAKQHIFYSITYRS